MSSELKGSFDHQYKSLVTRFKQLHVAQDVLAKIGHVPIGSSSVETKIFGALKTLKPIISGGNSLVINANLSAIEAQLREYDDWLQQCSNTVTPYGLRQYISQNILKQEELIGYARYLSAKRSDTVDDRGKLELLLSVLCKDAEEEERERLLLELFPEPPQLTYAVQELVGQMRMLTGQIESLTEFPQLINGDYMARARRMKLDLGSALWHPQVLAVVGSLNLALENCFTYLFNAERRFITEACRRLLQAGINSIGKLGENGVLNVDAAARLAEKADGLLEQNYQTNLQRLQQLGQIGVWLRNAVEMLDSRNQPEQAPAPVIVPRPPAERDSNLAPISTVLDYADMGAMEQQIVARVEEISQILAARPRRSSVQVIQLKRTVMLLSQWEAEAMVSLGNLVDASRRHHYDIIRRSLALVAELQESAIVFAEGAATQKKKSSYQYSVPATVYFLEQGRRAQGELETMSQTAREDNDIEMALNLLATRSKLQDAYQKILAHFKDAGLDVQ